MTKDELLALPPALALSVLVDALGEKVAERLADMKLPKVPRAPRFDAKVNRKGGFMYASEMDLESLIWWKNRFETSAADGGKYASKDAKRADQLAYWIEWRRVCPTERWTGQRNDEVATAAAPSGKPAVHEWEDRGQVPLSPKREADDDGEEDSIPF